MASHNMIDWVPAHANRRMLTDTLRNRFGLRGGFIGSDNTNVEGLAGYFRGFASNSTDAAVIAMHAGVDQDMPGASFLAADKYVEQGPSFLLPRARSSRLDGRGGWPRLFGSGGPRVADATHASRTLRGHRLSSIRASVHPYIGLSVLNGQACSIKPRWTAP